MAGEPPTVARLSEIEADFHQWREAHPSATLTELEVELDRRLRAGRARLLGDVAGSASSGPSVCPDCGVTLVANGHYPRQVVTQADEVVRLDRPYLRCPACGAGLFPPG
jgi:hypothetical protein